jgi:hypothetical protein
VWTATTTNPTIGNGTLTGRYIQLGKLVIYRIYLVGGTTTTLGTGPAYFITLPVASTGTAPGQQVGLGAGSDAVSGHVVSLQLFVGGSQTACQWNYQQASYPGLQLFGPANFVSPNQFYAFQGTYESV